MEATRPAVLDAYVLHLLASRPLSLKDAHETSTGQCRLLPRLAVELAGTAPAWASSLAPHAEAVAVGLARDAGLPAPATILTGSARRTARPDAKDRSAVEQLSLPRIARSTCAECGVGIPVPQKRCRRCHSTANADRLRAQQAQEAARRRSAAKHPSQERRVRERIGQSQRAQWASRKASGEPSGFTGRPSEFRRLILPRLARIAAADIASHTGLSVGYCAQIRAG